MPEFYAPFPLKRNPHLQGASRKMWAWIDLMGLAPTERARARMRATGADLSGAHVWPDASLDLLALGCRWLALCFRIDDQLDEDDHDQRLEACTAAVAELRNVLHGGAWATSEAGNSVVVRSLSILWQETAADTPQHWQDAFIRHFGAFLDSYTTEAALKRTGSAPRLQEYLQWRQYSVGMPWLFDLAELALPCYLPDDIRECEPMVQLRYAAALHIALANDVYSLDREILIAYPYNSVLIIAHEQGCSLQQAVDAVAELVSAQAHTFITARAELDAELDRHTVSAAERAAARTYADNCALNIRGQLTWHAQVKRYGTEDLSSMAPGRTTSYPDDLLGQYNRR